MVLTVTTLVHGYYNHVGLGSKLYPSNMSHILTKDLTQFMQSLSQVCQNWASKRKVLLERVQIAHNNSQWLCTINHRCTTCKDKNSCTLTLIIILYDTGCFSSVHSITNKPVKCPLVTLYVRRVMAVQIILMTALAMIIIILTNDHYLLFLAEINIKQQDGFKLRKLFSCQFSWSSFTLWVNYKKENINTQAFSNVKLLNVSYKMLHWTAKTLGIMITMISMGGIMLYM